MFQKIEPKTLRENVFSLFDDRWALITAGTKEHCNTMTASWGGLGVLWNKSVATIYVRPTRHTFSFLERSSGFSLSFFEEDWREKLRFCGTVSGRETDKFSACGFHVEEEEGVPYIREASLVLLCRKRYWQDLTPENMDKEALACYHNDYHRMYIGEITGILQKI